MLSEIPLEGVSVCEGWQEDFAKLGSYAELILMNEVCFHIRLAYGTSLGLHKSQLELPESPYNLSVAQIHHEMKQSTINHDTALQMDGTPAPCRQILEWQRTGYHT